MPIRLGDTVRQVNNSTLYPVVDATEVEVADSGGNFPPPSIRSYKDLESVLAFLATSSGGAGGTFVANFTNSALMAGDAVAIVSSGTVDQADANDVSNPVVGICIAVDSPSVGQCTIQVSGSTNVFTGLVADERYILSTVAGEIIRASDTGNPNYPNSSGDFIQGVGEAINSSTLIIRIESLIQLS